MCARIVNPSFHKDKNIVMTRNKNKLRVCSYEKMNLGESVRMDIRVFDWIDMCVFLVNLKSKINGFRDEFCE